MTSSYSEARTPGLGDILRAEMMKGRRAAPKVTMGIALIPFALAAILAGTMGVLHSQSHGLPTYLWCFWYSLVLPIAIALVSGSIAHIDARQKLRPVLGLPVSLKKIWWAKICYAIIIIVAGNTAILIFSQLAGLVGADSPALLDCLKTIVAVTLADAWMVPVGLVLTTGIGTLMGLIVPIVAELGISIAFSRAAAWWLFPPAVSVRAVSPYIGVEPSGVPLAPDDPLWEIGWQNYAGVAIAIIVFSILAGLGARWFAARQSA